MARDRKLRLWPLWLLLVIDVIWVLWIWRGETDERQSRLMATMGIQALILTLSGLHLLFFSRLSGRARLRWLFGGIAFAVLAFATLQIRGVSGDVVPILTWRWSQPPEARLANADQLGSGVILATEATNSSYPQFLGPDRNAMLSGPQLGGDWQNHPPTQVWRIEIGSGWSGFAVIGDYAITQEQRAEREMTTCYSLKDGSLVWSQGQAARYDSTLGGVGPRATPSISAGHVYTMGALGRLSCLELDSGRLIWSHDLVGDYGARQPDWGFAGSPLVVGDAVMINAGGNQDRLLLAFHKDTGEFLWSSGNDLLGYCSPQLRTLAGQEAIILLNYSSVTFHRPGDGHLLLSFPWKKGQPNVANPLVLPDDRLLVSSGYGVGATLYQIQADGDQLSASPVWKNLRLKAKFANYVYRDGYVYGLDDGILTCVSIEDGKRQWKGGRYGHGQLLLVGDKLLIQSEKGVLHLVEAQPQARLEVASFPVLKGKAWNTLALVDDLLLMRNHREAVCLRLPTVTTSAELN